MTSVNGLKKPFNKLRKASDMARRVVCLLSFCLPLIRCDAVNSYDINCPLIGPSNPAVVKLPYKESLNKGELNISIEPIAGRTDAVQVTARLHGFYESPVIEWTQVGCSTKKVPLDNGLERYDFEFLDLRPSKDEVGEVKLAIVFRCKSGSR